jgi:1-acyl-sn-glycerol-3-phosphate acyltransferase
MTVPESASLARPLPRLRVFVNRFIFRAMLFASGIVAIGLYQVNRKLAWRFAKLQARNLVRLCGVRVRVSGLAHVPQGPCVITPNHQSHFDIAALLGYLPGNNRFAAKKQLFKEPILGAVMATLGMIPIDRDDTEASIERLRSLRERRQSIIIFPEGTRSPDGRLLPFKKGAFVAAIELQIPLVPVVCKGTAEIMPKGGYLSILPGEVEIVVLAPVATTGMGYDDRERLSALVRQRIETELRA